MFMEEVHGRIRGSMRAAATREHAPCRPFLGLGSLWFTLFDKKALRDILEISDKTPLAIVLLGKPGVSHTAMPRKSIKDKTRYIR